MHNDAAKCTSEIHLQKATETAEGQSLTPRTACQKKSRTGGRRRTCGTGRGRAHSLTAEPRRPPPQSTARRAMRTPAAPSTNPAPVEGHLVRCCLRGMLQEQGPSGPCRTQHSPEGNPGVSHVPSQRSTADFGQLLRCQHIQGQRPAPLQQCTSKHACSQVDKVEPSSRCR